MVLSPLCAPSHLTTQSYASLVDGIKTRGTNKFFSQGNVCATTNELEHEAVVTALKTIACVGNLVIGTSGFCTLNLAAVRKDVKYILICDLSLKVEFFWKSMARLIRESSNRLDCRQKIQEHLLDENERYFQESSLLESQWHCKQLDDPSSWLFDNERYEKIKEIFLQNAFAFCLLDFTDTESCKRLAQIHQANGLVPDLLYTSNIRNFIPVKQLFRYELSLENLAGSDTVFVDTEEQPFKIGSRLSLIYAEFSLQTYINYQKTYGLRGHPSTQRVQLREKRSIKELYPIMNVKREPMQTFFLRYGIEQCYYTESELKKADALIDNRLQLAEINQDSPQKGNKALIAKSTIAVVFNGNSKTSYTAPKLFCSHFFDETH